jgi:hypothetical protein
MTDRQWPIEVVLSLITGISLVDEFHKVHEFIDHVAGHAVWTHEMAERSLWERLSARVFEEHPALREAEAFEPKTQDRTAVRAYLAGYVDRAKQRFGATLTVRPGVGQRTEHPIVSLQRIAGDKPVLVVAVEDEESGRGTR